MEVAAALVQAVGFRHVGTGVLGTPLSLTPEFIDGMPLAHRQGFHGDRDTVNKDR